MSVVRFLLQCFVNVQLQFHRFFRFEYRAFLDFFAYVGYWCFVVFEQVIWTRSARSFRQALKSCFYVLDTCIPTFCSVSLHSTYSYKNGRAESFEVLNNVHVNVAF